MKQDTLFTTWVWVLTSIMLGLVMLTSPTESNSSNYPLVSLSKPGCMFGITEDVNNCGFDLLDLLRCQRIQPDLDNDGNPDPPPPGPRNGRQCVLCQLGSLQIQGTQHEEKRWYDCTGDGHPDCEIWWGWAVPKGFQIPCATDETVEQPERPAVR